MSANFSADEIAVMSAAMLIFQMSTARCSVCTPVINSCADKLHAIVQSAKESKIYPDERLYAHLVERLEATKVGIDLVKQMNAGEEKKTVQ